METAILMGLIGLGYLQSNSNRDEAHPSIHPEINTPTHSSVYDQNNFEESKKQEEILAKDVIERMNKRGTNITSKRFLEWKNKDGCGELLYFK